MKNTTAAGIKFQGSIIIETIILAVFILGDYNMQLDS